ncbi:MAG: carboxypeptidase-like regulatory domain-containing protein, partial [Bacteroidetes bacterium]|nr:carboxypeptidase-like regulatory domain-containing protein [Bacteroidota bacterium]
MIRKLLLSFFIFISIQSHLFSQSNPEKRITATFTSQSLSEVLNGLSFQTGIDFYYKAEWLPESSFSLSFEEAPLDSVLEVILKDANLGFFPFDTYAYIIAPKAWLAGDFTDLVSLAQFTKINQDSDQILAIGDSTRPFSNGKAIITGTILNTNNQDPIEAGRITIKELKTGAISDKNGRYRLELPQGKHLVNIIATGYDTLNQEIMVQGSGLWDIPMELLAFSLDAVVVEANATDKNVSSVQIGVSELRVEEILKLPAFLGEVDVVKTLLTLPGVSNVGEGAGGFNVRGGNID